MSQICLTTFFYFMWRESERIKKENHRPSCFENQLAPGLVGRQGENHNHSHPDYSPTYTGLWAYFVSSILMKKLESPHIASYNSNLNGEDRRHLYSTIKVTRFWTLRSKNSTAPPL